MALLSEAQWRLLARLYTAGRQGILYQGRDYGAPGAFAALQGLRRHDPPLAREITRLDPENNTMRYLIQITDAGMRFYERNRRRYLLFYPPAR